MYQFLYLFGPGVISWLVSRKCVVENGDDAKDYLAAIAEIVAYAMVDMVVTIFVLKPMGRVQLAILANGMLDVQYGAAALLASIIFAVGIGIGVPLLHRKGMGKL